MVRTDTRERRHFGRGRRTLTKRGSLGFPAWLALLALGVQLLLPLSAGVRVADHGGHAAHVAVSAEPGAEGHASAADAGRHSIIHPASRSGTTDRHDTGGIDACALCAALQSLSNCVETQVSMPLVPSIVGGSLLVVAQSTIVHAPRSASYDSRAPPATA